MSENKVQFNLKNVHYAVLTDTAGVITYGTPVAVPGAVTLSLEPQGDIKKFYADGIVYYQTNKNQGYAGDLEVARIPDAMLTDIWGVTLGTTSKVLTENANIEPKTFALLYQIDGDIDNQYYVIYCCTGTRPGIGGSTSNESKDPQTQKSNISSVPLANGNVMARTTYDTPTAIKEGWFGAVFVEGSGT